MRLADRLNSFPVIAVAALLVASLLGFVIGLSTSDSVAPTIPQSELDQSSPDSSRSGGPLSALPSGTTGKGNRGGKANGGSNRRDPAGNGGKIDPDRNPNGNGGTTTDNPPIKFGTGVRKLPEGRADEILTAEAVAKGGCSIDVSVSDINNNPLPFALLALDVNSGPLGWQTVPKQPQAQPETRGVFRFGELYPGEYRVRSLQTNYKPVEASVRLIGDESSESVSITLEPLEYSQVEFFVHFEDGNSPDEVELRILRNGQDVTASEGRFGKYESEGSTVPGGVIPPTRYRQRTAGGGMVKLTLPVGQTTQIDFSSWIEQQQYFGSTTVTPTAGLTQQTVTLKPGAGDSGGLPQGATALGKLSLTLTLKGKPATFTRVNLYKDVNDFQYRAPSTTEDNKYVWQNIFTGSWFLVAESADFHAPYVQQIEVESDTVMGVDIKTGHLRVHATRAPGTPDPESGEARYRVRLRPMGSGTIERAYNGNLTGKQADFIDFYVPTGDYDVRVESPENYAKLAVSPEKQSFAMEEGGDQSVAFTISAATTLKFRAVNSVGSPVPNAEYLITFHAAGSVPESEKGNVEKGGYDGVCETAIAPSGPVYLMIWTDSTDWNNPDKVFELDLPAYGIKDLGAVVVQQ
ncbi:MAG: hypothetical protein KDB90_15660 [Planctomycetes bacterium]|nr:hypothetical protein [Planctomycetota bacterium]